MARKRSDLARKSSGVDGPDLNETYRESMAEAEAADAAPKPPRQNRPKPSCVGRVSGMKAWPQPYTNRVCVLVCDLLLAGLLGGAGAWLYIASQAHASSGLIHYACADSLANPRTCACDGAAECTVAFTLERDIPAPSFLMYQLENFKQAHRGYVKSVSWDQLTASSVEEVEAATAEVGDDGACGNSRKALRADGNETGPVLFPCGLYAQFVYNDTLELRGADGATVPTDETQLVPTGVGPRVYKGDALAEYGGRWRNTTSPRWRSWVRASPFELRKPYGKIDVDLPAGEYTMKVTNDFDASIFLGSKAFVITHYDEWSGNALSFDGLAYAAMATGGLALLLALFVGFLMLKGAPVDRKCNELEDAYKPIEKEIRRDSSFAEEMEGETPGMREDSTAAAALAEKELEVRRGLELIARYAAAPTVDALEKLVSTQRRTLPIVRRAAPRPPRRSSPSPPDRRLPPRTSQGGGALGSALSAMSLPGASSIGDIVAMAKMASQGACSTPRGATEESPSIAEEPGDAVGPEASGPFGLAEGSVPESFATEEESVAAMLRTASAMPAASSSEAAADDDSDLLAEDSLAELRKATSGVSGRSSTASGARALSIKHEDPAQNEEFEDDDDFVAALAWCAPPARPSPRRRRPLTPSSPRSQHGQRDPDAELQAVKGS